jgi:hypothetical protein
MIRFVRVSRFILSTDQSGWGLGWSLRKTCANAASLATPQQHQNDLAHSPGISSGEVIFNNPNPQYE